ncbi:unnamed protein product [Effrenium voratum]|nr:unnamed protein product [Effrenium voratum]
MWQEALQLLGALEASPLRASAASFASSVASESSAWRWALRSLRRSELRRVDRTVVAQNSAISACQKGLAWQVALHLLRGMTDHGLVPDATSFSAAISACDWELALALLAEAQKVTQPNLITYNAAITACERNAQWQRALELLTEAARCDFKGPLSK